MNHSIPSDARLTRFAVSSLWHRRLSRALPVSPRVHPRVSAELLLHPVVCNGQPVAIAGADPRAPLDVYRAA